MKRFFTGAATIALFAVTPQAIAQMEFPKPRDKRSHPIEYPFNLKAIR